MSGKYLRVTMSDGSEWDAPAKLIANDRARCYCSREKLGNAKAYNDLFQKEFDYAINNDAELLDWAAGNMNWLDVAMEAEQTKMPDDVDYQEGWVNGKKQIIEK